MVIFAGLFRKDQLEYSKNEIERSQTTCGFDLI